jgi:hypothetical protein
MRSSTGFLFQFKLIYYRPVLNVGIAEPSSILTQYVDASLGSNVIFGLDELSVVYRVVDTVPHKILLKFFISAIAAAGDYVVCLSTTNQCLLVAPDGRVEELRLASTSRL